MRRFARLRSSRDLDEAAVEQDPVSIDFKQVPTACHSPRRTMKCDFQ